MGHDDNWFRTHCYHCGRTVEDIILRGPTPDCLCAEGNPDTPISTLEAEAMGIPTVAVADRH